MKLRLGQFEDPKDFLKAVMASDACDTSLHLRAAGMLLANEIAVERIKLQLFAPEEIERWPSTPAAERGKTS